ncbi:hypothetical protein [Streptomyces triticiradicis]|uniref:LPXTG cell wall anchor domain-containing protein n=1 Tax=Streptomyces triticiradicis TaxID=2651189 RepID=A0A7J5DMX3_9ACTN|nr:hypothetical protein [Streptomyces triticiradicis]KAB1990083.1 hypothetical protein F8144_03165 [Streptomyces triticiradicis]
MPRRESRVDKQPSGRTWLLSLAAGLLLSLGTPHLAAAEEDTPRFDRAVEKVTTTPGATFDLPGGFTNSTGRTLHTVYLEVQLADYLSFGEEFGNCWYEEDLDTLLVGSMTCRLDGTVRSGRSYDLDLGEVNVDNAARFENIYYRVHVDEPPKRGRRGTGRPLGFSERGRPDRYVRAASHDSVSTRVDVDNSIDFALNEVTLRGKRGDKVKADFFFVNNGPAGTSAVFDDEEDNETAVVVDLTVPPGLTAVEVPDFCRGKERGHGDKGDPGASHYYCWQNRLDKSRNMSPGQFEHFPFVFRIDRADNRPGRIGMAKSAHIDDSDPSNDSAAIKVDIAGAPAVPSASRSGVSLSPVLIGGGIAAALALSGGALWLRRRSETSRTLREES